MCNAGKYSSGIASVAETSSKNPVLRRSWSSKILVHSSPGKHGRSWNTDYQLWVDRVSHLQQSPGSFQHWSSPPTHPSQPASSQTLADYHASQCNSSVIDLLTCTVQPAISTWLVDLFHYCNVNGFQKSLSDTSLIDSSPGRVENRNSSKYSKLVVWKG